MSHYMAFSQCMINQSAINNGAVVHMYCPPNNVMYGQSGTGNGDDGGDHMPQGPRQQVPARGDGRRDDQPPPRPGRGAIHFIHILQWLGISCLLQFLVNR